MPDVSLSGTHNHKSTWSTLIFSGGLTNWQRMVNAHGTLFGDLPNISGFIQGTYNVILDTPWAPPDDDMGRTNAHNVGVTNSGQINNGADFLEKGNYVHPDINILSINGILVQAGKLYYAGSPTSFSTPGIPGTITRNYLEILSTEDLETLTGTSGGESVTVIIRINPVSLIGTVDSYVEVMIWPLAETDSYVEVMIWPLAETDSYVEV